mmetsp:Transcript_46486/g.101120  ORF Transcript_46486/g.101120 Transcript_46486/m.101120 type:complete len:205 (-) Transcript_46486:24-638(-)
MIGEVVDAEPCKPLLNEGLRQKAQRQQLRSQGIPQELKADVAVHGACSGFASPVAGQKLGTVVQHREDLEDGCWVIEEQQQACDVAKRLLVIAKLGLSKREQLDDNDSIRLTPVGPVRVCAEDPCPFRAQGGRVEVNPAKLNAQGGQPTVGMGDGLVRVSLQPLIIVELQNWRVSLRLPEVLLREEAAACCHACLPRRKDRLPS